MAALDEFLLCFFTFFKVFEIEQDGKALNSLFINKFLDLGDQIAFARGAFEAHNVDV